MGENTIRKDAVQSALLGLAVGDALGVPVEFMKREVLSHDPVKHMRGFGTYMQPPGTWSDDTSLTLCLVDSLSKKGEVDYEDIMRNFADWMTAGRLCARGTAFDIGNATGGAIRRFLSGTPALECGGTAEYSCGNGSLMRILPMAFFIANKAKCADEVFSWEDMEDIHKVSALTHAHPICLAACGIYVLIARNLIAGMEKTQAVNDGLHAALRFYRGRPEFESAVALFSDLADIGDLDENEIASSGYVAHTLRAALWCLLTTGTYQDCVLLAVNLGEDTDTTAAVAGGLAGLLYGTEAIPSEWLQALAKRDEIAWLCQRFEEALK